MTQRAPRRLPPIALLGNGQFYVRDQATITLYQVVRYGVQALRLQGAVRPDILELFGDLKRAADEAKTTSAPPLTGIPQTRASAIVVPDDLDLMTTKQVADFADVNPRYVRDIANQLGGRKIKRHWHYPRRTVTEWQSARTRKDDLDEQARQSIEGGR
jgi:hypothetical protein